MIRRPPRSTRTDTLFPYTTLVRSSIGFDVTLNGLGGSRSPLTLAFDPPFLAMTLALAAVALLLGWRARGRFGEIGRAHVELQSLMRISYAVFCLNKKHTTIDSI